MKYIAPTLANYNALTAIQGGKDDPVPDSDGITPTSASSGYESDE